MIYLDNSATTFPKPEPVRQAMAQALIKYGANPGRAGHRAAMASSEAVYRARAAAADFFGAEHPEQVIFTPGCTWSLNMVLRGRLKPGDHVVISCVEHNAVYRTVAAMAVEGIHFTAARIFPGDDARTLEAFESCIKSNTKMIVCTHGSNVFGIRLPVEKIAALAHRHHAEMVVDAAQSAGVYPYDLKKTDIDFLCCSGHKGLYGPMGIGLLIAGGEPLEPLVRGGTGSRSVDAEQPEEYPDRLESGTPNVPGIVGLAAGIRFVMQKGIPRIAAYEEKLMQQLKSRLAQVDGVQLYVPADVPCFPVLSFNISDIPSEEVAERLDRSGIAVRAGLHCAPLAHRWMGTLEQGTVRVSVSAFNHPEEMERLVTVLKDWTKSKKTS
jgi:cysteine desulfurase family protein